jgi:hypothetical protein
MRFMSGEKTVEPRIAGLPRAAVFVLLGVVALAVGIGAVVYHFHAEKRRAWAEVQKRLDAIRAAGEPVTADDLAKLYPDPPPERDAKLLLAPAVAAYREPDAPNNLPFIGYGELPGRTQPLTEQMRTNIEAFLNENKSALDAVPWDKLTNAWFEWSFALGSSKLTEEHVHPVIVLGKMLCLKAVLQADSGNGSNSCESLLHSLALFHTFRSEVMVHHLLRRTGEKFFCDALERVINRARISTEDLAVLDFLLSDDDEGGLREVFVSMRCENIGAMSEIRASITNLAVPAVATLDVILGSRRLYTDTAFSEMLDMLSAQIAAFKLPPKQRFAELNRLKAEYANDGHRKSIAAGVAGTGLDFVKLPVMDAEMVEKLHVCRVALEVERWRRAHGGRAPDSLAELAPEFAPSIPLDPFDNNPLRYKKLAKGFIVYSIGPDFADDGGKEKPAGSSDSEHYDITFSVER